MTGQRIVRPATAFSVAYTKQKRKRTTDERHLKFVRSLRCCICGKPGPDAAHIRASNPLFGKRETGMGEKASDRFTVPLCREHHDDQHKAGDELAWWEAMRIDPFLLAAALHHASGDDEIADTILQAHLRRRKQSEKQQ